MRHDDDACLGDELLFARVRDFLQYRGPQSQEP